MLFGFGSYFAPFMLFVNDHFYLFGLSELEIFNQSEMFYLFNVFGEI